MTTIATDGKSMAGDGLVTGNGYVCSRAFAKVRRLKDGRVVGISGSAFHNDVFIKWLEEGGDVPKIDNENFEALVLQADGSCLCYDGEGRFIPEDLPTATGSGRQLALGAMAAGASPFEAVQIACERDTNSGGEITALDLVPQSKLEAVA